jgi:small subunit ribosomal protein S20
MPQHKSVEKRVRQNATRRTQNRVHRSRMRTVIKKLKETENPDEAATLLKEVKSTLDRMVNKGILKKNTAANYKSSLEKSVNALS